MFGAGALLFLLLAYPGWKFPLELHAEACYSKRDAFLQKRWVAPTKVQNPDSLRDAWPLGPGASSATISGFRVESPL